MKYYLVIRHRVKDYSNWRNEFDSQLHWRQTHGERSFQVFTDDEDPNMVTVMCEWENLDSARRFISDPLLSEIMQVAGVLEQPTLYFLKKE